MIDLRLACWGNTAEQLPGLLHEEEMAPGSSLEGCSVISDRGDLGRVAALIDAGADEVLLGESALLDRTLIGEAVALHGGERIGIWLPVRRAESRWGFDTVSNADFSTLAFSNPVPRWLIGQTDVDACWWATEMLKAGCGKVLVSVAEPEDEDLSVCAEMAECAAEHFWLDTGSADIEELRYWVRYGQARQLVLPAGSDPVAIEPVLQQRLARDEEVA